MHGQLQVKFPGLKASLRYKMLRLGNIDLVPYIILVGIMKDVSNTFTRPRTHDMYHTFLYDVRGFILL